VSSIETIAEQWFGRVLESYPQQTGQFLAGQRDRFRNPVGHTFREALSILVEEVLGGMEPARIASALDAIVRIRAVQDFTPSQAVGFVFLLRDVLAQHPDAGTSEMQKKVDELALQAFDAYQQCREQIAEIRGREAWRCPSGVSRNSCGG
jgi:hypothetical protein